MLNGCTKHRVMMIGHLISGIVRVVVVRKIVQTHRKTSYYSIALIEGLATVEVHYNKIHQ